MDRDAFLAHVRERLARVEVPPLPEALPRTFASGDGRLFDRFAEELSKVAGQAMRVAPADLEAHVADLVAGAERAVVADGVGPWRDAVVAGLARAGCEVRDPAREAAAAADVGVTAAELAVAATGSVLVRMGPGAPRAASLLPPFHLVVLPEHRIVPGFEELFAELPRHAADAAQTVLITGPSRTSDIERTLVWGVHGPMRVVVLVVAG